MKVYELHADLRRRGFGCRQWPFDDPYRLTREQPVRALWRPVVVEPDLHDESTLPAGDFASCPDFPMFSERAIVALEDMLARHGEILPLTVRGSEQKFFAYNVLTKRDALDLSRSEYDTYANGGVGYIRAYVFHVDRLVDAPIFRPQIEGVRTFVTEEFVKKVQEARLEGFRFDEKFDSSKHQK